MALTEKWYPRAESSYDRVIRHLEKEWSDKEVRSFIKKTRATIENPKRQPNLGIASKSDKCLHKLLITKHNYLLYKVRPRKKEIALLLFWDTRQHPKKLKTW